VALTVTPAGLVSAPAQVVVGADHLEAEVPVVVLPGQMGDATVTAQLGSQSVNATLHVRTVSILLSEVAVQGPAGASDEFVELYNPTPGPIDVAGWKVQYKSVTGATYATKAVLPAGATVAPHGYYLVAGAGYAGPPAPDFAAPGPMGF